MREEKLFAVSRVIRCALIFTALALMLAFSNSLLASDDIKLRFSTKWPAGSGVGEDRRGTWVVGTEQGATR